MLTLKKGLKIHNIIRFRCVLTKIPHNESVIVMVVACPLTSIYLYQCVCVFKCLCMYWLDGICAGFSRSLIIQETNCAWRHFRLFEPCFSRLFRTTLVVLLTTAVRRFLWLHFLRENLNFILHMTLSVRFVYIWLKAIDLFATLVLWPFIKLANIPQPSTSLRT